MRDEQLIKLCLEKLKFTHHAKEEMLSEEFGEITEDEIKEALQNLEIMERYPNDRPYPSFLILGTTQEKRLFIFFVHQ